MPTLDDFRKRHTPELFAELTFADTLVEQHLHSYAQRRNYDHVLLHGPYGSAKTSTARVIIAERQKVLGIGNVMIEAYEAGDIKGKLHLIANSVSLILSCQHQADLQPYVLIEEVDQLSPNDQNELRSIINTLPIGKLILTTNKLGSLDGGLVSRCDAVEVLLPTPQQFVPRAQHMVTAEGLSDTEANLLAVMQSASLSSGQPSMRDIIRVLFQRVQRLKQNTAVVNIPAPASGLTLVQMAASAAMPPGFTSQGKKPTLTVHQKPKARSKKSF